MLKTLVPVVLAAVMSLAACSGVSGSPTGTSVSNAQPAAHVAAAVAKPSCPPGKIPIGKKKVAFSDPARDYASYYVGGRCFDRFVTYLKSAGPKNPKRDKVFKVCDKIGMQSAIAKVTGHGLLSSGEASGSMGLIEDNLIKTEGMCTWEKNVYNTKKKFSEIKPVGITSSYLKMTKAGQDAYQESYEHYAASDPMGIAPVKGISRRALLFTLPNGGTSKAYVLIAWDGARSSVEISTTSKRMKPLLREMARNTLGVAKNQ